MHVFLFLIFFTVHVDLFAQPNNFFIRNEQGLVFPAGFLKGVSASLYQNGGHRYWPSLGYTPSSNWSRFENEFSARFLLDRQRAGGVSFLLRKSSPIDRGEKVGISADGWNHLFEDVQLIKNLGCNAYRFEIPWTDLNPEIDVWNEEAFSLFDRYIDELKKNGIEPIVTLYHWVHPLWFENLGGWQREENIKYFVRYARNVFKRFGHKVRYWCTINEPTVISACGYILGTHAPGKKDYASLLRAFFPDLILAFLEHSYQDAGTVLANLFKAHIETYHTIKSLAHGPEAKVTIIHQVAHFNAKEQSNYLMSLLTPFSQKLAAYFNKCFAHDTFMRFFQTGHFVYEVPGQSPICFTDSRAPRALDFFALNFYADMSFDPWPTCDSNEQMTDMTMWAIRPASLYDAIKEISSFDIPIIITENGICDAVDDRRQSWIIGYSNAIYQAIKDGYDVRGYCYWSLLDNFEWNMGHSEKFGLYAVNTLSENPEDKIRTLKTGAHAFRDYIKLAST